MELFSITVQMKLAGVQLGLTFKDRKAMDEAYAALTGDTENIGIPLELTDDFGALVSLNTADILFVRSASIAEDLRRNAEHQFEQAHANSRLQRRVSSDPLLTPTERGGLVGRANA